MTDRSSRDRRPQSWEGTGPDVDPLTTRSPVAGVRWLRFFTTDKETRSQARQEKIVYLMIGLIIVAGLVIGVLGIR
jgi:hypothetical protein